MKIDDRDAAVLPSQIPIFPLPSALLLPGGQLPLNIFEPRYLAMIEDALGAPGRLIGMVQPMEEEGELSVLVNGERKVLRRRWLVEGGRGAGSALSKKVS